MEDFEQAAYRRARSYGHPGLRPEHGLLVILEGAENDPAKRTMLEAGLTVDEVTAVVDSVMTSRPQLGSPWYLWPTPPWTRAVGRTEGFVHTLGQGAFRPAHFLLAVLWDTT